MGLGELLTTEEKIASLQKMKKSLSVAIYPLCVELGIEPESFDYSTYVCPVGNSTTGFINPKFVELEKYSNKLVVLMAKIEELQSA
jgi:hypothetical protein